MSADTRAALAAVQAELRQPDGCMADTDGEADPLTVAETLVALSKMKNKAAKLTAALAPSGRPDDDGPNLPGFEPNSSDGGPADGRRRRG